MAFILLQDKNGVSYSFEISELNDGNSSFANTLTDLANNVATLDLGGLAVQNGGRLSALNITAAKVIKASPGRLRKIIVIAPGSSSGAFTFNDCITTGAAAASNEIWTMLYNATANVGGAIFTLDWPCLAGIVISAVPGSGSPIVAVSYD